MAAASAMTLTQFVPPSRWEGVQQGACLVEPKNDY
jgi:hypothetical protein